LVLAVAYANAWVDRQMLALLIEPIKLDLHLSDFEFSLLVGLAFAVFFVVISVPLAWVADNYDRRFLISAATVVWSGMTALCGLANSFWTLFIARVGVGVGEAALNPAAFSMICDSFPPERRGKPMAVYAAGAFIGVGVALMVGGAVIAQLSSIESIVLPVIGELRPWQAAFLIVSAPGILIALIIALLGEPPRHNPLPTSAIVGMEEFSKTRRRTILTLMLGYSLLAMAPTAFIVWIPAVMMRVHGWEASSVGLAYGAIMLLCSPAGLYLGGSLTDRLRSRGQHDAVVLVSLIGAAVSIPFAALMPLMPSSCSAIAMLIVCSTLFSIPLGLPGVAFGSIAPNRMRARLMAIYLMVAGLIAGALGPSIVATISDFIFEDSARIGDALSLVSAVALSLSVVAFSFSRKSFTVASVEAVSKAEDGR
jgi:MFS family permease